MKIPRLFENRGKTDAFLLGVICVVAGLLYIKTLAFRFTYYDDHRLILNNLHYFYRISNIFDIFNRSVFLDPANFYYRPLLTLSYMLDAQLSGPSPFGYHATNVVLHLLSSCLVFLMLDKMNYARGLSFFFALLFAVHPASSQAVAWIPGRNDVLLTLFILLAFLSLLRYLRSGDIRYCFLHAALFLLALLTKENAIAAAAVFLWYTLFVQKEAAAAPALRSLSPAWLSAIALFLLLRHSASFNKELYFLSMASSVCRDLPVALQYLGKAFFPFNLSVFPPPEATLYGIAAAAALAAGFAASPGKRNARVVFGCVWFLAFLLPTFVLRVNVYPEPRLYLPMIGLFFVVPEIFPRPRLAAPLRRAVPYLGCAILLLFCAITYSRSDIFMNRLALWESAAGSSPRFAPAHLELGRVYLEDYGLLYSAEAEFTTAARCGRASDRAFATENIRAIRRSTGEAAGLRTIYDRYLASNVPFRDKVYYNYALLSFDSNDEPRGERYLKEALNANPAYSEAYEALITYYVKKKRFPESRAYQAMMSEKCKTRGFAGRPPVY